MLGGRFVTKPAPIKYWERVDPFKTGNIPVMFQGQVVIARPLFDPFTFKVPSKEFIEKYFNSIGISIRVANDTNNRIWWDSFQIFTENTISESDIDYPYTRLLYYDEQWKVIANAKNKKKYFKIVNEDGSEFLIDPINKLIKITNKEAKSSEEINDKRWEIIDGSNNTIIKSNSIKLGAENATESGLLGDKSVSLLSDILDAITQLTVTNGAGVSGPPNNLATFTTIKGKLETLKSKIVKLK